MNRCTSYLVRGNVSLLCKCQCLVSAPESVKSDFRVLVLYVRSSVSYEAKESDFSAIFYNPENLRRHSCDKHEHKCEAEKLTSTESS